jgi:hypothetical protein
MNRWERGEKEPRVESREVKHDAQKADKQGNNPPYLVVHGMGVKGTQGGGGKIEPRRPNQREESAFGRGTKCLRLVSLTLEWRYCSRLPSEKVPLAWPHRQRRVCTRYDGGTCDEH